MKKLAMYVVCFILLLTWGIEGTAKETEDVQTETVAEVLSEAEIPSEEETLSGEEVLSEEDILSQEELLFEGNEDPQLGRANGYLSEGFVDSGVYTARSSGYVHNSRFDGYEIRDVIDVSSYQTSLNWKKVKDSGINYAIIRAGFRGYGETGSLNRDTHFKENMTEAIQYGLKVGVYFFSQAISEAEAIEEANYVLNLIKDYKVTLPVVIDFEYASDSNGLIGRLYKANLSKSQQTAICKAFCKTIAAKGYTPMIYANKQMLENDLNAAELAKSYKIWLANYTNCTSYGGEYEFWQYTSSGSVSGIYGNVDKSFWYIEPEKKHVLEGIGEKIKDTGAIRVFGSTRFETSFKIADSFKAVSNIDKFKNVIVTNGQNFADALAGSYLSYLKNAPVLMTNGKNTWDVKKYINKNLKEGGTVYILGGTDAVPEAMETGLENFKVKRLGGKDRYETNIAILKEAGVSNEEILICTGKKFADSLSASATERPILLVNDNLTNQQKNYLSSLSGEKFYIIGGTDAVSQTVEKEVKDYGKVKRISGATRMETSVLIAETFFDSPKSMVLAVSDKFPDGLCGGLLAMGMDVPLILTKTGKEAAVKAYAAENQITEAVVLGGSKLISDETVANIFKK